METPSAHDRARAIPKIAAELLLLLLVLMLSSSLSLLSLSYLFLLLLRCEP